MSNMPAWSYSGIKAFETCPLKYYHTRVAKDIKEPEGEQALYGKELHKAAEDYIALGTPIPPQFAFMKDSLDSLNKIEGVKLCEEKLALTEKLEPCDFFAEDCWYRGIADLLIINEETGIARCVDYKTGKSKYADIGQLELMSLAIFKKWPKIHTVKCGLLFIVEGRFIPSIYSITKQHIYWQNWMPKVTMLQNAYETNVWNAKPNGLCRQYCWVLSCAHCGRK